MTTNWIEDVQHNLNLIKNNPAVSSKSKLAVEEVVIYFLETAKKTEDYNWVLTRFNKLKSLDSGLEASFALTEISRHVKHHLKKHI